MKFPPGSEILFVGEGDFSFVTSLCSEILCDQVSVVATCLQEKLSERAIVNTETLKGRDIKVISGVDATKLHAHPHLKERQFSHIVFNFPHVGGKMKIHLNRLLLQEFFRSAVHVISDEGQVLVSLCAGQGGVALDSKIRRWDDSWQVILMASYANLVLVKIEPFDVERFLGYSPTGYRSMEKSFGQEGSLVYTFQISQYQWKPSKYIPDSTKDILCDGQNIKIPTYVAEKLEKNVFANTGTVVGCISQMILDACLIKPVSQGLKEIVFENMSWKDLAIYCRDLRNTNTNSELEFFHCYRLKRAISFKVEPLLILVSYTQKIDIDKLFNKDLTVNVCNKNTELSPHTKKTIWKEVIETPLTPIENQTNCETTTASHISEDGHHPKTLLIFNIYTIAQSYFGITLDELWADGQHVTAGNKFITYSPASLCSLEYTYDLSFWESQEGTGGCLNDDFDQNTAVTIINNIAQESLVSYDILSSYCDPVTLRKSYTYRIKYRCYSFALSDTLAKTIHKEIGKKLEEVMGVQVR